MKFSRYTSLIKHNSCYLLHNTLYNKAIRITSEDLKKELDKNFDNEFNFDSNNKFHSALLANKMIIDEEFDESAIVTLKAMRNINTLVITLIVTRACNFDCYYCSEKHETQKRMSKDIYIQTVNFIEKELATQNFRNIHISFFGGEPTLELNNIFFFLDSLKDKFPDVNLTGDMTTNGYLLNKQNFLKLLNYNVKEFQITLDGLAHTHNQSRYLVNRGGSWDTIVKNLKDISELNQDYNYLINLRTNLTKEIIKDAEEYCKFYYDNFGKDSRFSISYESVKDYKGNISKNTLVDSEQIAVDTFFQIANSVGIKHRLSDSFTRPFGMVCNAGRVNTYVIDYNGDILKCTLRIDDEENKIGNIASGVLDLRKLSQFVSYKVPQKCLECVIYPICFGKKCPLNHFSKDYCELQSNLYRNSLVNLYIEERR